MSPPVYRAKLTLYKTCSPQERTNYETFKSQLLTHFTPVHIQAVHSNLFHQRRQGVNEAVDHFAQELWKLFYKVYPRAGQESGESEGLGRAELAYQFVAGLVPSSRTKVANIKGNFEQLLVQNQAKIKKFTPALDRGHRITTSDPSNQQWNMAYPNGRRRQGGTAQLQTDGSE